MDRLFILCAIFVVITGTYTYYSILQIINRNSHRDLLRGAVTEAVELKSKSKMYIRKMNKVWL